MRTDVVFPADYEVQMLKEQPTSAPSYTFVREGQPASGGDVHIEVMPWAGEPWVGAVCRSSPTVKGALTVAHPTPHRRRVCVVASGDAYLIDVDRPQDFKVLQTGGPVVAVYPVVSEGLLLLASPWVVTAVDGKGPVWQTERLAIDGFRLDEVDDGRAAGVADPGDDEPRDFVIDLRTGRHDGGVPFS